MRSVIAAGAALLVAGVGLTQPGAAQQPEDRTAEHGAAHVQTAKATLQDGKSQMVGEVTFRETQTGVLIRADLRGVPAGTHAFHLHEVGACDAPTFESAGGHFSPAKKTHGFFSAGGPHAGDLPNVHVAGEGRTSIEMLNSRVTLSSGAASLLDRDGSAVVIHTGQDDYRTDPAGGVGDRIACGVIERTSR